MVIRHETTVRIARPPSEVMEVLARLERQPDYWESVRTVRLLSGRSGEPGARYERVIDALGKVRHTVVEILERDADARLVYQSVTPPMQVRATFEATPAQAGTELRLRLEGRPEGRLRLLSPLLKRRFVHHGRVSLDRLQALLEGRNATL